MDLPVAAGDHGAQLQILEEAGAEALTRAPARGLVLDHGENQVELLALQAAPAAARAAADFVVVLE